MIFALLFLVIYFLPSIIAVSQDRSNKGYIFVLNLFVGGLAFFAFHSEAKLAEQAAKRKADWENRLERIQARREAKYDEPKTWSVGTFMVIAVVSIFCFIGLSLALKPTVQSTIQPMTQLLTPQEIEHNMNEVRRTDEGAINPKTGETQHARFERLCVLALIGEDKCTRIWSKGGKSSVGFATLSVCDSHKYSDVECATYLNEYF